MRSWTFSWDFDLEDGRYIEIWLSSDRKDPIECDHRSNEIECGVGANAEYLLNLKKKENVFQHNAHLQNEFLSFVAVILDVVYMTWFRVSDAFKGIVMAVELWNWFRMA